MTGVIGPINQSTIPDFISKYKMDDFREKGTLEKLGYDEGTTGKAQAASDVGKIIGQAMRMYNQQSLAEREESAESGAFGRRQVIEEAMHRRNLGAKMYADRKNLAFDFAGALSKMFDLTWSQAS